MKISNLGFTFLIWFFIHCEAIIINGQVHISGAVAGQSVNDDLSALGVGGIGRFFSSYFSNCTLGACSWKNGLPDNDINKAKGRHMLTVCYPAKLLWEENTKGNVKPSRRYRLSDVSERSICAKCMQNDKQCQLQIPVKWVGVELEWALDDVTLKASLIKGSIQITGIIMKHFSGKIDAFMDWLFNPDCGRTRAIFHSIILNEDQKVMADGAFFTDIAGLAALQFDVLMSKQTVFAENKNLRIFYKIGKPNQTPVDYARELAKKACLEEMRRWIQLAGFYAYKPIFCENTRQPRRGGVDASTNPNPNGTDQMFGGKATEPLIPTPLRNESEQLIKMQPAGKESSKHQYPAADAANRPRRSRRDVAADPATVDDECENFSVDLRTIWESNCKKIIGHIHDQGDDGCENGYAMATAGALTDRACLIVTKNRGGERRTLWKMASNRDAMECHDEHQSRGCNASWPSKVWKYYQNEATVNEKCKPMENARKGWQTECFFRCDTKTDDNCSLDLLFYGSALDKLSYVEKYTQNNWRNIKLQHSDLYTASDYRVLYMAEKGNWEQTMMDEIATNGSIVAVIDLYDDLEKSNPKTVYKHSPVAKHIGMHAVRLIGYGELRCPRETIRYWLAANSWGTAVHDAGVIRIHRGENECGIETKEVSWGSVEFPHDG